MYAITGITGQVGGVVARQLLDAGRGVRAIVRSADTGAVWGAQGCEVALADMTDARALTAAFRDTEGVFVLLPPNFAPSAGFGETRAIVAALREALAEAQAPRVVCLSTIGAQAERPNLLQQLQIMERELGQLDLPIAFLRAAWFMENALWDVEPARARGVIPSFLQPLDKPVPMVATADIGQVAADLLLDESWHGKRVVELEGPARVSPDDIAAAFTAALGHPVRAEAVARESWEALFKSQGTADPTPRIQMLDGFNEGWIEFEGAPLTGTVELDSVVRELVARAG
jgi:uncharacterized protein YbjT (DUF2867 family)